jgi:hypothetical protein
MSLQAREWRLSGANGSDSFTDANDLTATLLADKDDLEIEIERDDSREGAPEDESGQVPAKDDPASHALSGVERSREADNILDGQVVDDATGRLIPNFRVIPGYQPPLAPAEPKPLWQQTLQLFAKKVVRPYEMPIWEPKREDFATHGVFALAYRPLSSKPMFLIEAEGYGPYVSAPASKSAKNLLVRLKRAAGPNGVVLLPNGEAASNVIVLYAATHEVVSIKDQSIETGTTLDRPSQFRQRTDRHGAFSFELRANGQKLYVADAAGWAEEDVRDGGHNLRIRLRPWAVVIGTLVQTNGWPMGGLHLIVPYPFDWLSEEPWVDFQKETTTDAQGRFEFRGLPPRELDIVRWASFGSVAGEQEQMWFVAHSGTNDLGKVILDKPPPRPAAERLKQKLRMEP